MLTACLIGDIHLDGMSKVLGDKANELQMKEVDRVVRRAYDDGLSEVWLLGDICHYASLSDDGYHHFQKFLLRWDGKITIRIIGGNHDFDDLNTHSLRSLMDLQNKGKFDTIHIYKEPKQEIIGGVTVNFLPFPYHVPLKSKATAINVAHLETKGAVRDNGHLVKEGLELDVEEGVWVLGHLHKHQEQSKVYYPGTLYQTNFGEELPKGYYYLKARYLEGKLKYKFDWHEHSPSFQLFNMVINSLEDLKQVSTSPLHLTKLFLSEAVTLPANFLEKHPNIIRVTGYRTRRELKVMMEGAMVDMDDSIVWSPLEGLDSWLSTKYPDWKERDYKRTAKLLQQTLSKHGLNYTGSIT